MRFVDAMSWPEAETAVIFVVGIGMQIMTVDSLHCNTNRHHVTLDDVKVVVFGALLHGFLAHVTQLLTLVDDRRRVHRK